MNEQDLIREEDLDATHSVVRRMCHRSMIAAVLGGFFFAAICALVLYYTRANREIGAALIVGVLIWLLFGVPLAWRWWRHYTSIFQQLAQLRRRVRAGETVYGSEVVFHRTSTYRSMSAPGR